MSDYTAFLATKRPMHAAAGIEVSPAQIHPMLFGFQRDLTRWALRKGRAAIFADAGLGKTFMQLEWARLTGQRTLILAPLSVARQTVAEAEKIGVRVVYARRQADAENITVTNYEMMEHFAPGAFGAIVLDESSILKATEGVTRNKLIAAFQETPYRLCCTATPAPNDIQEITNHAEFLGVMRRRDVLATFFLHDASDARSSGWRLKRHAREMFWRWLASWGMSLKWPSDIGYEDDGYVLPPLKVEPVIVATDYVPRGHLFPVRLRGVTERAAVRRHTHQARVRAAAERILSEAAASWVAWVGLNDEGRLLTRLLGERAILIEGAMNPDEKARRLEEFIDQPGRVLVTKSTIAGFGMNFQHCSRMVFVGIGDSYEQYYQAIRRCWRFGQLYPVRAAVVISEPERVVYDNLLRKEREAEHMARELVKHVAAYEHAEIGLGRADADYTATERLRVPKWLRAQNEALV